MIPPLKMSLDGATKRGHLGSNRPVLSFRVALRSQPSYAAATRHPVINISFVLEPFNVLCFGAWAIGLDLPIVFCNPQHFEGDPRGFAHGHLYACDSA